MSRIRRIFAWAFTGALVLANALATADMAYASPRGPAQAACVVGQQVESRGVSLSLVALLAVVVVALGTGVAFWVRSRRRDRTPGK